MPLIGFVQWQWSNIHELGAANGQIVFAETYGDKLGGLTFNTTTPYVLVFIDLAAEGPFVVDLPEGELRGAAHDMWQVQITQATEPGKYLFVGPGQEVPEDAAANGFAVHRSPMMNFFFGVRLMSQDRDVRQSLLERIHIYPYAERANPKPRGYLTPNGRPWLAAQPRGMAYWERLADSVNAEAVAERDRFFMAMLKPLGIEKGRPFAPDERQTRILSEAAFVGEAMTKALDFEKRVDGAHYVDDVSWHFATVAAWDQRADHHEQLDERAAWFYEAVTNDVAMHGQETGWGQVYLSTYKDADGDWLDGGTDYVLHVPPDVPAETFWSITLYDVATRCIIRNDQQIADRSSRTDIVTNDDQSVDIFMGPNPPAGRESNWIPTVAGRAWFPYFRLYSPTARFMDRSWVLPDIRKAP